MNPIDDYAREKALADTGFEQWWAANAAKLPVADDNGLARAVWNAAYTQGCQDMKRGTVTVLQAISKLGNLLKDYAIEIVESSTPQGEASRAVNDGASLGSSERYTDGGRQG